ncbi:putative lipid II flippase FtsW, partial [Xanthomonas perforans]
ACMLVLGGAPIGRIILPILLLLPALVALVIFEPYRMRRVTSFMDPWVDQLGSGYQLSNALMAIGRGQWTGVGLGASVQKLNYLPESHTDFIFSVIAEELGFVGVCGVIGLYALLVGRAFWLGMRCVEMKRHFSGYIAFGIGLWIAMQSFVSIGVNLGILPTKGLTLPLISSGGSSVLMTCLAMGVLLRVSYEADRAERLRSKLSPQGAATSPAEPAEPVVDSVPPAYAPAHKPQRDTGATPAPAAPPVAAAYVAPASAILRGTSRMQPRVEPTFGRIA